MKKKFSTLFILVNLLIFLFISCKATHQIAAPKPNFIWNLPAVNSLKAKTPEINIAIVSPSFKEGSKFGSYRNKGYLKTFLDSLQSELEKTLISKRINITGPYESLDVMTFPQKKRVDLIFIPQVILNIDEQYKVNSETITRVEKRGNITVSGTAYFAMLESLSLQKLWVKTVKFPPSNALIEVNLLRDKNGNLNPFFSCKDNFDAAFVDVLNKIYPEIMGKFWSYLDPEEIAMLKKEAKMLREKKVY